MCVLNESFKYIGKSVDNAHIVCLQLNLHSWWRPASHSCKFCLVNDLILNISQQTDRWWSLSYSFVYNTKKKSENLPSYLQKRKREQVCWHIKLPPVTSVKGRRILPHKWLNIEHVMHNQSCKNGEMKCKTFTSEDCVQMETISHNTAFPTKFKRSRIVKFLARELCKRSQILNRV